MYHNGDESVLSAYLAGKPVLMCAEGGAFRSVAAVGMLEAFAEIPHHAKAHIGVSGGACAQAGFLSGESKSTFSVYEKLARDGCFTYRWAWPFGLQLHFDREKLIREIEATINLPELQRNPSAFGISVLKYDTGEEAVLDGKENTLHNLSAGVSIAGACEPTVVGGVKMVDGMNIHVTPAIRKYWARDVIVLRSRRRWRWEEICYPYVAHANLLSVPPSLRHAIAVADWKFEQGMERLRNCTRIRCLELGPSENDPFLWPWTRDVDLLTKMRDNAREYVLRLLNKTSAM